MPTDHNQNFRIRGLPRGYETRASVRDLVKEVLSLEPNASVIVHSLATCPVKRDNRVATLRFNPLPDCFSDRSRNEWVISLTNEDDSDFRAPLIFDTHFSGFTPLQRDVETSCNVDVIAMSGLGGHAFGSFKERGGPFMWLRDALPLDIPNARILIYGYDTQLVRSSSFQNLSDLGRALQIDLRGIQDSKHPHPIVFIGHSLGGLVIKEVSSIQSTTEEGIHQLLTALLYPFVQTIVRMKEETHEAHASILDSISGFIFFGVPHQGLAIESLVPLVKNQPNRSLLESLNRNSALLQRLDKEFNNVINARRPSIVSFYETEKSPTAVEVNGKWELSGPSEVLVDVSSATCYSNQRHPIDRNHSEMVKYSHGLDVFYRRVITVTREILSTSTQSRTGARSRQETAVDASILLSDDNKDCLRSLSFREQEYRYSDVYSTKDTCGWLLEDPEYQAWMNSARGLFWIKGNPGTGKSVLMKFAVTTMDRRGSGELVVSFFIHGRGNPLQKTPLGVFRALLSSMLKSFPQHLSQLTERFKDRQARFGAYEENRWNWTERELQDFMSETLTKGTKKLPVVIFVDALDESGEDDAKSLLTYFKTLMDDIEREQAQVKICFSSRHYPILGYETMSAIHVEEKNDQDIRLVVRERLKEIQPVAKRQQLENEILMKAHGGFQWTILIVALILHGSAIGNRVESLHKRLTTIPEALDGLYADILSDVDPVEQHQVTKLFQWVLFAARPLSSHELREALAIDYKDKSCRTISQLRQHDNWTETTTQFERIVTHISKGLVEFRTREIWEQYEPDGEDWDREAQFVHQSVADYVLEKFIRHDSTGRYSIGAGHFEISRSCLSYLTLREVLEGARLSSNRLSARFPLIPYTAQFLFHHIREVERAGIPQEDLLARIHWGRQSEILNNIASLWRVMDPDNIHAPKGWPFVGATSLHVLVGFGSESCLDAFLVKDDAELEVRDADGNTPLLLALRECREDMALLLLDRSIEWQLQEEASNIGVAQDNSRGQPRNYLSHLDLKNHDGETPLTVAATVKAGEVIFKLIEAGADLELFGHPFELVSYAIRDGNKKLFSILLEKGVKHDGAIFSAVKGLPENVDLDVLEILSELLKAGGNTRKSTNFVWTSEDEDEYAYEDEAMIVASRRGLTAIVSLLLLHGASAEVLDDSGNFPLLVAARNGHEETVKVLLHHAPQMVEISDSNEQTAFDAAVVEGYFEWALMLLPQEDKAVASVEAFEVAVKAGEVGLVRAILRAEVKHAYTDDRMHRTPFFWAVLKGDETAVELLLQQGEVYIDRRDGYGQSPLSWAAREGHEAVVALLLDTGLVDANARDYDGQSPLSWAAQQGHEAVVRLLLLRGEVNVNARDHEGQSPLSWAAQQGHGGVIELLLDLLEVDIDSRDQYGYTPLWRAIQHGYEAAINLLVVKGHADVNVADKHGRTPLLWATQHGQQEVIKLLLDTGKADIDREDRYGQTPLFWAVKHGHEAVVKLLVETGKAAVDGKDQCGRTPLLVAAQHGHEAVIRLLLDTGKVDVDGKDQHNRTPLSWAAEEGYDRVVKLLMDTGKVDVDSKDQNGRTPLSWAAQRGQEAVVWRLKHSSKLAHFE
ncbi:hypothetical protein JMJ77_0015143 [Colletotrichum scovillei]|uniref:Nephrocystin 3-like N-terminal domain-containing protein n=1 Tax=Colletotrichum scovillei TaxID=1209932 RepID=A0A9P7QZW1_9PEZI|nr:hypothetical protein JMJ77_0015143 [Colletotrichum scovillei]KAG7056764.1 hypothetical protein JMJ78_0000554 [Colletotrichum scovillei]